MAIPRKSLKIPRSHAFSAQKGCCYYCGQPMWKRDPGELVTKYSITLRQAKLLQCTGEHLVAHKDGGSSKSQNIVASCYFCNSRRHYGGRKEIQPEQYKARVIGRLSKGRWHGLALIG